MGIIERGADPNDVINRLVAQIGEMTRQAAIKDSLIAEFEAENKILKEKQDS